VLVAEGLGLDPDDIRFEPRLMEIAYGIWEGLRYEDIEVEYRRLWQARQADRWSFTVPGGESYATLSKRALTWLEEVDPAARLIVVSHGGTGRVLRGYCDGLLPTQTVALAADHEAIHILAPKAARAGGAGSP
jgi:probable phosphoglycerate mutase